MKNAIVAAIVAAIVSVGAAAAGTAWINGAAIKPGTIRISRLAPGAIAKLRGAIGPVGPAGPQGGPGPQGPAGAFPQVSVDDRGCLVLTPDVKAPLALRKYGQSICPKTVVLCVSSADGTVTFGDNDGASCPATVVPELQVPVVTGWSVQ